MARTSEASRPSRSARNTISRNDRMTLSDRRVLKKSMAQSARCQSSNSSSSWAEVAGGRPAAWRLERRGLAATRVPRLVRHDRDGLGQVERRVTRIGGDGHHGPAQVQLGVGEAAVLTARDDRHRSRPRDPAPPPPRLRVAGASAAWPPARGRSARRWTRSRRRAASRDGRISIRATKSAVLCAMPSMRQGSNISGSTSRMRSMPKLLRDPHGAGDVDDVLWIDQHEDGRQSGRVPPGVIPRRGRRRHAAWP